jgi:hypothetical protein
MISERPDHLGYDHLGPDHLGNDRLGHAQTYAESFFTRAVTACLLPQPCPRP